MIAIINDRSNASDIGVHHYRVQINHKLICEFDHIREEGLAVCLRKAADAVEKQSVEDKLSLYKLIASYAKTKDAF